MCEQRECSSIKRLCNAVQSNEGGVWGKRNTCINDLLTDLLLRTLLANRHAQHNRAVHMQTGLNNVTCQQLAAVMQCTTTWHVLRVCSYKDANPTQRNRVQLHTCTHSEQLPETTHLIVHDNVQQHNGTALIKEKHCLLVPNWCGTRRV